MRTKQSLSGLKSKRNGEYFERFIEQSCFWYRKKGIAEIKKTPEPLRVISTINRTRGIFKAVFTKKAQPDFTGTLKGGRSVMFEAKHTEATNIAFSRINIEQEKDLNYHENLGAYCFVLISFNSKYFYAVPWRNWKDLKEHSGKKSVNKEDIHEYEIPFENGILKFLES